MIQEYFLNMWKVFLLLYIYIFFCKFNSSGLRSNEEWIEMDNYFRQKVKLKTFFFQAVLFFVLNQHNWINSTACGSEFESKLSIIEEKNLELPKYERRNCLNIVSKQLNQTWCEVVLGWLKVREIILVLMSADWCSDAG